MAQNNKEQNDYKLTYYNTISSRTVEWLWYPYIPYGKITILQGDPGEGKSTMMLQLAALITAGKAMPDGSGDKVPGNVIYQAAEDGIEDTIKPRLLAAGADCGRIAFLENEENPITLDDERLEQAIKDTQAKLLVIDPLQAYLGIDNDMQRSNSTRSVFGRLAKVAERTGCAVVLIGHMNKSSRSKGIYRGLGSIDIAAVARSILLVGRDSSNPYYRIMVQIKNNLAPEGKAFVFELNPDLGFSWIGQEEHEMEDLLFQRSKGESKLDKAKEYLKLLLNGSDMPCADILEKMRATGIGTRTVEQAKKDMGIISYKLGDKWYWRLSEE
ncbi:MAG: AAA family ATPase [Eubacterium sp.]|nr:AAA family ATPase [Eubacterium sp.]